MFLISAVLIYFVGEGVVQGMAWKGLSWKDSDKFHAFRVVEWIGMIGMLLVTKYGKTDNWFLTILYATIAGVCLYERVFCIVKYDDVMYHKKSKWFGIPHMSPVAEFVIFFIFITLAVII